MSSFEEWASSRSNASHFAHMFFAPATVLNPFFYQGLYESTQDGSTAGYVGEHLLYLSPWLPSAFYAGQSPFHIWSSGLQVMRYVAADAGLLAPAAVAGAVIGTGLLVKELVGDPVHYQSDHDRIARARRQASSRERPAWANL